jgi:dienelactone hydrolase
MVVVLLVALISVARANEPTTIQFASEDDIEITADLYLHDKAKKTPMIVLFHQAGWSRGEYKEIAPRLVELGFNCLAVDARSGKEVNGVTNETARRAKKAKKKTSYVHALPDLRAALIYARENHAKGTLIAWGSSYSSALVLRLAGTEPDLADAWLAFAPGEYFGKLGKSRTWIRVAAAKIDKPVFITSARREHKNWSKIYDAIPSKSKVSFVPSTKGNHGSRALWKKFGDSAAYWTRVRGFLKDAKR